MSNQSDISIQKTVQAAQRGDRAAFQQLYDSYSSALYGLVVRIVQSEEVGQDVLQDSFVKIWRNLPKYDESKGTIFTWMLNISRNTAIDYIRKKKRTGEVKIPDGNLNVSMENSGSTSLNINAIGLPEIVGKLPQEQQAIVRLIYFEGFTQKEASEELDIPLGTVKSRVRIAMRELRKLFTLLFTWI